MGLPPRPGPPMRPCDSPELPCHWCLLQERRRHEIDMLLADVGELLRHAQRLRCPKHGSDASEFPSRRASGG